MIRSCMIVWLAERLYWMHSLRQGRALQGEEDSAVLRKPAWCVGGGVRAQGEWSPLSLSRLSFSPFFLSRTQTSTHNRSKNSWMSSAKTAVYVGVCDKREGLVAGQRGLRGAAEAGSQVVSPLPASILPEPIDTTQPLPEKPQPPVVSPLPEPIQKPQP